MQLYWLHRAIHHGSWHVANVLNNINVMVFTLQSTSLSMGMVDDNQLRIGCQTGKNPSVALKVSAEPLH